jgi:hypothetical protein
LLLPALSRRTASKPPTLSKSMKHSAANRSPIRRAQSTPKC